MQIHQGDGQTLAASLSRCDAHWAEAGPRERTVLLQMWAWLHALRGEHAQALSLAAQALEQHQARDHDGPDVAVDLTGLAGILLDAGQVDSAEAACRKALDLSQVHGEREWVAIASGTLADVYLARQDWLAAEARARQALTLSQGVNRLDVLGADHHRLARALLSQGRPAEAMPHARQAAEVYDRLRAWELREAPATLAACEAALAP